ncbi:MAG: aminotransferase class III-fold pyridoxal phosphate-dependent enzyme [Deinococcales bacterium]|nr:aminotransferase class III-fold pyridoxal phosphate-dependent enzyme [Deinococcales bacterium]
MNDHTSEAAARPHAAPAGATDTPQTTEAILAADARHRSGLWSPDVVFVRGEGARLFDADGREYLDCMAGIAVASVGHANPRLARALAEQAQRLIVAPQNLGNDVRTRFTDELFELVKPPLNRVFYSNSGAEANEAALKWARVATGRRGFVAVRHGFSGRSMGVLPLTWEPKYREPFGPFEPDVRFVTLGDARELEAAVDDTTAAVLLEPIQGEGGIRPASDDYLRLARELTRERGALLVFDEIQTGVGRTGTFLASEPSGVSADIVTLAKGLGGGVPIGATLMTDAVAAAMPAGGHGTTFGGNPLSAAAGLAVLEEIQERDLLSAAKRLGERLMSGLRAAGGSAVREVRGRGLLVGVETAVPAGPVIQALRDAGVLTIAGGGDTIRYLPPLVISEAEVDEVVARSAAVFARFT